MASKINVNTIDTQSGTVITIPTGKTLAITDAGAFTIGGAALAVGSNTVRYETADYTILGTDVLGKTECVVGAHAGGGNRTITLPLVTEPGMDTCIITVVCTQDSGQYNYMKVGDNGGAELWRGTSKNDFARFIVMNGGWNIIAHHETFYERRYLSANQSIGGYTHQQLTGWTVYPDTVATNQRHSIGNIYNAVGHETVAPFDAWAEISLQVWPTSSNEPACTSSIKIKNVTQTLFDANSSDGRVSGPTPVSFTVPVNMNDNIQYWWRNNDDDGRSCYGGAQNQTQFHTRFTARYTSA